MLTTTQQRSIFFTFVFVSGVVLKANAQTTPSLYVHTQRQDNYGQQNIAHDLSGIDGPIRYQDQSGYTFYAQNGQLAGSGNVLGYAEADYGVLSSLSDVNSNQISNGTGLGITFGTMAQFTDNIYLAPKAGQAIGTPITLTLYRSIGGGLSTTGSPGTAANAYFDSYFYINSTQIDAYSCYQDNTGYSRVTQNSSLFQAHVGDNIRVLGQLITGAGVNTNGRFPAAADAGVGIADKINYTLLAPNVTLIGTSGHDYSISAVPEPGTIALLSGLVFSGGLLLRRRRAR